MFSKLLAEMGYITIHFLEDLLFSIIDSKELFSCFSLAKIKPSTRSIVFDIEQIIYKEGELLYSDGLFMEATWLNNTEGVIYVMDEMIKVCQQTHFKVSGFIKSCRNNPGLEIYSL